MNITLLLRFEKKNIIMNLFALILIFKVLLVEKLLRSFFKD